MDDIASDEIVSTLVKLDAHEWEGTHLYEATLIVRTFRDTETGALKVGTRYYTDGKLVKVMTESWRLHQDVNSDSPRSSSGKSIEEFVRLLHYTDPSLDISIARDLVE